MRTISICGLVLGLFIAGFSIWRWSSGYVYDSPFRSIIGLLIALSIMAWAYVIDWMTMKDKEITHIKFRIDSIQYPPK